MPVSPLLRELVERATVIGMLDRRDPLEAALATLLVAELTEVGPPPLAVPEPAGVPARRAAELLATGMTVAQVAAAIGVGRRTLERVFRAEVHHPQGRRPGEADRVPHARGQPHRPRRRREPRAFVRPHDREPGPDVHELVPVVRVLADGPAEIRGGTAHDQVRLVGHRATFSRHQLAR